MKNEDFLTGIFKKRFAANISSVESERLNKLFRKDEFKKNETIFRMGDSNTRHYFIEKGLLRLFIYDKNGREFNIEFAKENQILGDLSSPSPTSFNLEAIEHTTAYSISDEAMKSLIRDLSFKNDFISTNIIRKSYIKVQQRLVNILVNSAEENYAEFRKMNPDLIQRLPQYHIAAYLGVRAEFLSKTIAKSIKKE